MSNQIVIAAFYKFFTLADYEEQKESLQQFCKEHAILGTILVAHEGINGTISGSREGIDAVFAFLRSDERMRDLEYKESYADEAPFHRMRVRLKKEIVSMGQPIADPTKTVGRYVRPQEWNQLISDPDVTVIDTRNDYEVAVGTFANAWDPQTFSFRDFPEFVEQNLNPQKHKKVAMFCTGGIRCEKATSYLLQQGFDEVYHLEGGILKYLEEIPAEESLWEGECFVFDNRVTVDHDLEPGNYEMCFGCKRPLSEEDMQSPAYEPGICCPYCIDDLTPERRASFEERQKQVRLARERNEKHIGQVLERD